MILRGALVNTLIASAAIVGGALLYAKYGPRRHRGTLGTCAGMVLGHEYGALAGLAVGGPVASVIGGAAGGVAGAILGLEVSGGAPCEATPAVAPPEPQHV